MRIFKLLSFGLFYISTISNGLNIHRRVFVKATTPFFMNINTTQNLYPIKKDNIMYLENSPQQQPPQQPNLIQTGGNTYIQTDNNNIYYYGAISTDGCYQLKNVLNDLDKKTKIMSYQFNVVQPPPIHLHIQSLGGELLPSLYIIDVIDKLETPVYTYIDGFAASAATLISIMVKKRFMTEHSLMLIHQLSGQNGGKFNELKDEFTNMNTLMKMIKELYLKKTNLDLVSLENTLYKDIWLDSKTCLKYGLVDEII